MFTMRPAPLPQSAVGEKRDSSPATLANASGLFSGSGSTSGIDNLSIWLFLFYGSPPNPNTAYLALATGSDSSWRVQSNGTTTIDAATADSVIFGTNDSGTIALGIAPFPEPAGIVIVAGAPVLMRRQRGRCGS